MEFTNKERIILYNQYEILKKLYPEEQKEYEIKQKVIKNGYVEHYEKYIEDCINLENVSEEITKVVYNILSMYLVLRHSYLALKDDKKNSINKESIVFKGFSKDEKIYKEYAEFLIKDLELFKDVLEVDGFKLESYSCMFDIYKNMLDRWIEVRKNYYDEISLDDINYIININSNY